jgi:hypothetical protein
MSQPVLVALRFLARAAPARLSVAVLLAMTAAWVPPTAAAMNLAEGLAALQKVGAEGDGHAAAIEAWPVVAQASPEQLPEILASMRDENRLATNWVRAAVDAIAERTLASGGSLPVESLEAYIADRNHSSHSRRLAYEWLVRVDEQARQRWLPKLLDDPSLELRRDAVAARFDAGKAITSSDKPQAVALLREALKFARDKDQVDEVAKALRDAGETVDLPTHFGFLMNWHLIGPFDNRNDIGWDQAYPPEQEQKLDTEYTGMEGAVRWTPAATTQEYGELNLNDLLGKHKGAVAYAVTYFDAQEERPAELRLGCINANKVWLNGELLTANHVYHAGESVDQYVGTGRLKAGRNVILLKICQNEQTEDWAQDWKFQLRVCDPLGTAILPVPSDEKAR